DIFLFKLRLTSFNKGDLIMVTVTKDKNYIMTIISEGTKGLNLDITDYQAKSLRTIDEQASHAKVEDILIKNDKENIDETNPEWTYVTSRIYMNELYNQAAYNRNYDVTFKYGDFYKLITTLIEKGIYSHLLIEKYSKNEIESFAQSIDVKRDELFDYLGLYTFATRYLA